MPDTPENFAKIPPASAVPAESSVSPATWEHFIEQAIKDYESPLIGYACTLLNDPDRARDVVQDTFAKLCQQEIQKVEANLKSWLFTVCRNRAFDLMRKDKRVEPLEDIRWKKVAGPGLQPDEAAEQQDRAGEILGYMNFLKDNQREVILLKFQQGLSYHEIQEITGLSASNIGFLIHTGLKRLREILPADL